MATIRLDCEDSDCSTDSACIETETVCDDGVDNDGDEDIDCEDSDCSTDSACIETETVCDDGVDNDGDDDIDCEDSDCDGDSACTTTNWSRLQELISKFSKWYSYFQ